jgi:hypothetical protein
MAAGYVSGAAALVFERESGVSSSRVAEIVLASATPNVVDERRGVVTATRGRLLYIGPIERVLASK